MLEWIKKQIDKLRGNTVEMVEIDSYGCGMFFSNGFVLGTTEGFWRIIVNNTIIITQDDYAFLSQGNQKMEVDKEILDSLKNKKIMSVKVNTISDLIIKFAKNTTLEVYNTSSKYESWQLNTKNANIIVTGGGELAILDKRSIYSHASPEAGDSH